LQWLAHTEAPYWSSIEIISKLGMQRKDIKILEIGSGMGYFTYALNKAGYNAVGVDNSVSGVAEAQRIFGDYYLCVDIADYAKQHAEEYDIVFSTETIEHVDDALSFLKNAALCCKSANHAGGGKIIVTTPNKSIYPVETVWHTTNPPFHVWWFSETSIRYMAEQINANVSFMDWTAYHAQKYCAIRVNPKDDCDTTAQHYLDENGIRIQSKSFVRAFFESNPFAKKLYQFARRMYRKITNTPEYRFSGQEGPILCAVFEKR
jgi:SAM-dependent methyltransferase